MRILSSFLLSLFCFSISATASDGIPDDKAVILFKTKTGLVTFNHRLHASVRVVQCESCHHTHKPDTPYQPCSDCHKNESTKITGFSVVAPKNSKTYHTKCKGCHQYTLEELKQPSGPTKCKLCHIK